MPEEGALDQLGRAPADQAEILRVLVAHEVRFLLVGGIAVRVHGHPRSTLDVDVLPDPSSDNMRRLAAALSDLDAAAVDDRHRRLELDLSHPESLALGNYFLTTRAGALDLVNGARPDLLRYRRLEDRAVEVTVGGLSLLVIGLDDLIAMKREAGREKDLRDIAALTELERLQHGEGG
ncbi:MAG: DUF6036 family nucleotidyltransferase [Thermoleophilaceae bacterium]